MALFVLIWKFSLHFYDGSVYSKLVCIDMCKKGTFPTIFWISNRRALNIVRVHKIVNLHWLWRETFYLGNPHKRTGKHMKELQLGMANLNRFHRIKNTEVFFKQKMGFYWIIHQVHEKSQNLPKTTAILAEAIYWGTLIRPIKTFFKRCLIFKGITLNEELVMSHLSRLT